MTEYLIERTGLAPLRVTGEILAEVSSEKPGDKRFARWYVITIYQAESGRFAVRIDYRANGKYEINHTQADVVDDASQISAVLIDYDPLDHVRGFPKGERFQDRQRRLFNALQTEYNRLIGEVLASEKVAPLVAEEV